MEDEVGGEGSNVHLVTVPGRSPSKVNSKTRRRKQRGDDNIRECRRNNTFLPYRETQKLD